tara:strand:+ start:35 stop:472 length:438 start_codon:yes stop_codon:yes gene_type:complete
MASFSASPSSLVLDPFTSSGRTTNATAYGNAVNLGNIYKANRANAFDPSGFIAQDTASSALEKSSAMQADANAYATSLDARARVSQAKKRAEEIKAAARKNARKSMFGSALGAVAGIGGTILSGGNPMVGMAAAQGGKALGSAFG